MYHQVPALIQLTFSQPVPIVFIYAVPLLPSLYFHSHTPFHKDLFVQEIEVRGYVYENVEIPQLKTYIYTQIEEILAVHALNDHYTPKVARKSDSYKNILELLTIFSKHTHLTLGHKEYMLLNKYMMDNLPSNQTEYGKEHKIMFMRIHMLRFPEQRFQLIYDDQDVVEFITAVMILQLHSVLQHFSTSLSQEHTEETKDACYDIALHAKSIRTIKPKTQFPLFTIIVEYIFDEGFSIDDATRISLDIWKEITKKCQLSDSNVPVALDV
ncbi:MAG: hypothetical protein ACRCY4_09560 [Brevinema sp.]